MTYNIVINVNTNAALYSSIIVLIQTLLKLWKALKFYFSISNQDYLSFFFLFSSAELQRSEIGGDDQEGEGPFVAVVKLSGLFLPRARDAMWALNM